MSECVGVSWSTKKSEGMGGDEIDARNRREGVEANRRKKWEQNTETRSAFKRQQQKGERGVPNAELELENFEYGSVIH